MEISPDTEALLEAEEKEVEENSNDRLLVLSDGVFAIVITLLILEIKVPHPEVHPGTSLWRALAAFAGLWPSLLGYVLSFVTVGIMWMNHCVLFRYITKNDHLLTVLNSFLLLVVAFIPFVTAVLSDYLPLPAPYPQAGVLIYTGSNVFMAVAFNVLWNHASYKNRLLDERLDPRLFERVHKRYRFGPAIYVGCFLIGLVSVPVSLGIVVLLALIYSLPYGDTESRAIKSRIARFMPKRKS